ncbi:MAG: SRPBCC family protein [Myxococcales bacterium]|nr:SRPBCC family protein [Myxococcales bacterium]
MTPLVLTSSVLVDAPIETVWSVLVDVERWTRWCPPVRRVTHFEGIAEGRRLAYVLGMGPGVPVSFDVTIETCARPHVLQWWSTKWWGVTGTRAFLLSEVDGGTNVEDRKTFQSRIWPVARLYPRSVVGGMSNKWLDGLAAEVLRRSDAF